MHTVLYLKVGHFPGLEQLSQRYYALFPFEEVEFDELKKLR